MQERWQYSENDLRHVIISGEVKPSIWLIGKHKIFSWDTDNFGDLCPNYHFDEDFEGPIEFEVRGWRYLQDPVRTEPFDCEFRLVADDRDPDKGAFSVTHWIGLNSAVNIGKIKESAVFLLEEIAMYEDKYGNESEYQKPAKPLATRERDTLLSIIAALCKEAKIDYSKPAKAAGMIQSTAVTMGVSIGETTIENHLKKIPEALATRMK